MRVALYQAQTGLDPEANARDLVGAIEGAAAGGASMLFTPEMSGLLDRDRERAERHLRDEASDPVLAAVQKAAAEKGIWMTGARSGRAMTRFICSTSTSRPVRAGANPPLMPAASGAWPPKRRWG